MSLAWQKSRYRGTYRAEGYRWKSTDSTKAQGFPALSYIFNPTFQVLRMRITITGKSGRRITLIESETPAAYNEFHELAAVVEAVLPHTPLANPGVLMTYKNLCQHHKRNGNIEPALDDAADDIEDLFSILLLLYYDAKRAVADLPAGSNILRFARKAAHKTSEQQRLLNFACDAIRSAGPCPLATDNQISPDMKP